MGELRGRPDRPPDEPGSSGDRPRTPEPPSESNNDPRAIRRAWRESDAFAPGVEVRYVTNRDADTGPANARPYRTSKDRPAPETDAADGSAHRPPDLIPPRGEDLAKMDAPGASRGSELRRLLFDEENVGNVDDVLEHVGDAIDDIWLDVPERSPSTHTEARPPHAVIEAPNHAIDTRDVLTTMFITGILLGETVRVAYRKASELKERWQRARNG